MAWDDLFAIDQKVLYDAYLSTGFSDSAAGRRWGITAGSFRLLRWLRQIPDRVVA